MQSLSIFGLGALLLSSSLAVAQPARGDSSAIVTARPDQDSRGTSGPAFVTLDQLGTRTGFSASLAAQRVTIPPDPEIFDDQPTTYTLARLQLQGQLMNAQGQGVYASLPVVRSANEHVSLSGVGNVELGAVATSKLGSWRFLHRAGLVMPTLSGEEMSRAVVYWASLVRMSDYATAIPSTTLRLATSPMLRAGRVIAKADLGVDVPLDDASVLDAIGRANLGLGVVLGPHQLGLEATFQMLLGEDGAQHAHTLGVSYRLRTPSSPFLALHKANLTQLEGRDASLVLTAGLSL